MKQVPETLLAKSKREGRILSLEQHLLDTEQAAIITGEKVSRNHRRESKPSSPI